MQTPPPPTSPALRRFVPAVVLLLALGWTGFAAVLKYTSPNGGTRWLLFFFAALGLTGLALPVTAYLNRRFPSVPPPTPAIILRQAIWFSIYITTLAWLQIGRVLTPSLALLLAAGLVLIEWLLRLRERSQWKPRPAGDAATEIPTHEPRP